MTRRALALMARSTGNGCQRCSDQETTTRKCRAEQVAMSLMRVVCFSRRNLVFQRLYQKKRVSRCGLRSAKTVNASVLPTVTTKIASWGFEQQVHLHPSIVLLFLPAVSAACRAAWEAIQYARRSFAARGGRQLQLLQIFCLSCRFQLLVEHIGAELSAILSARPN